MAKQRNPDASLSKLDEQIDSRRSDIRTDKLDMTYGEFANMYEAGELVVAPAYQRLFRWNPNQKSRFIESILLGIPTPALFVAETEDGIWELVDGLQRLSTVLEFFGVLKDADGMLMPASTLVADDSSVLPALDEATLDALSLRSRLSIRRAGCRVEVVKVGSGRRMKYDLFERLNTGGAQLTEQEIRNCIFRAEAPDLMDYFDRLAQEDVFQSHLGLSENQQKSLYDRGLVLRFFALKNDIEEFRHDVEPFVTEYVHKVVDNKLAFDQDAEQAVFKRTMSLIAEALGDGAWRHIASDGEAKGAFSVYVFEALALAVARNIEVVGQLSVEEIRERCNGVKVDAEFKEACGAGRNTRPHLLKRLAAAERIIVSDQQVEARDDDADAGK